MCCSQLFCFRNCKNGSLLGAVIFAIVQRKSSRIHYVFLRCYRWNSVGDMKSFLRVTPVPLNPCSVERYEFS